MRSFSELPTADDMGLWEEMMTDFVSFKANVDDYVYHRGGRMFFFPNPEHIEDFSGNYSHPVWWFRERLLKYELATSGHKYHSIREYQFGPAHRFDEDNIHPTEQGVETICNIEEAKKAAEENKSLNSIIAHFHKKR